MCRLCWSDSTETKGNTHKSHLKMASDHWLSCCCVSAGAKESEPGLNARVRRTRLSLNLEISAQCWLFHSHTAAKHLLVVQFTGALRTHG